jgi:6-pyruvoyltetrahydropterin/6-carboxytetrahydropterin synthase
MHKLARQVRFSINPFLSQDSQGFNPFVSRPAGEGLSVFLELSVEIEGPVEPDTGFVLNVVDIDRNVHQFAVPIFAENIRQEFRRSKHVGFTAIVQLLKLTWSRLSDKFGSARLSKLSLKLNPYRKISINSKDLDMVFFSEKFEFAAMHKLWNENFSKQRNFDVFGKCANPTGHGHNYILEVTIKMPANRTDFSIGEFERVVDKELIQLLDHKNLNVDIEGFKTLNPTVENISGFAWNVLAGKFDNAELDSVTIWETDKTYCTYTGSI